MSQTDLAQVLVYNMLTNGLFLNAIKLQKYFKIRRAPGCETYVAMETSFMCTAQYFLKNIIKLRQGDIDSL